MEKTQENILQNKKSFILYLDSADIFEQLTDQEAGKLIKAVLYYVHTGEKPELPRLLNMAFIPIYQALHRDLEKWRNQVEANRKNGKTGGRPPKKKTENNPKNPSGYFDNPKNPDSVNDTDTVNDTVNTNVLSETEINLIITNWQKQRLDDFKINGKFSTGIVVNKRKELTGKSLKQVKSLLESYNLELTDDLSFARQYTNEEKRMLARGLCLD
jgi:hypothetical protein